LVNKAIWYSNVEGFVTTVRVGQDLDYPEDRGSNLFQDVGK